MADGWFPLSFNFAIPKYFGENADDAEENARYVQTVQGLMASGQVAPGSCETSGAKLGGAATGEVTREILLKYVWNSLNVVK